MSALRDGERPLKGKKWDFLAVRLRRVERRLLCQKPTFNVRPTGIWERQKLGRMQPVSFESEGPNSGHYRSERSDLLSRARLLSGLAYEADICSRVLRWVQKRPESYN